jgi:uncharacterized membrane-anchored protein
MGCVGSIIGSCLASCGCEALRCCCPNANSSDSNKPARWPYLVTLFLSTVVAIILRFWGGPMLIHIYMFSLNVCGDYAERCVGFGAVYRISFALCVWFVVMGCLLWASSCSKIDAQFFGLKILSYVALVVAAFFIPNEFFEGYGQLARVMSGLFLLLQIIILIDFAYQWNEDWMSDEKEWKTPILIFAVTFFTLSLVLIVYIYKWFGGGDCNLQNFFATFTIITTLLYTTISISSWCEHGALLPSSIVCLYCHYLCFSALSSDPSSCNTIHSSQPLHLAIGLILGALSVTYAAWNLATSNSLFGGNADNEDSPRDEKRSESLNPEPASDAKASAAADKSSSASAAPSAGSKDGKQPAAVGGEGAAAGADNAASRRGSDEAISIKSSSKQVSDDEIQSSSSIVASRSSKFHFIMAMASMYMAMVLTNWATISQAASATPTYDLGKETMWIKIVSQWLTVILYTWSLCAPYVLSNREFAS